MILQVRVKLTPGEVPLLEGALDCAGGGIASSLLPQNMSAAALVSGGVAVAESAVWPLLFDPQTAGGLLAGCVLPGPENGQPLTTTNTGPLLLSIQSYPTYLLGCRVIIFVLTSRPDENC